MVVALVVYFVLSRKFRTPTITTEILVTKYNSKLKKLERFFNKNKIELTTAGFESQIEKSELNLENLEKNVKTIHIIEQNSEVIEEIYLSNTADEVKEKFSKLKKPGKLCEFQDELKWNEDVNNVFQMLGYNSTKLDFEQQRYFGSQNFYKIEDKLVFVSNFSALILNSKNVFDAEFSEFQIITEKLTKKTEKSGPKYKIILQAKGLSLSPELIVTQKEGQKVLEKFKKGSV